MPATENDVVLRRKLRTKEDIDILRKEAEKILEQYAGIEKSIRKSCEDRQKSALKKKVFISMSFREKGKIFLIICFLRFFR